MVTVEAVKESSVLFVSFIRRNKKLMTITRVTGIQKFVNNNDFRRIGIYSNERDVCNETDDDNWY